MTKPCLFKRAFIYPPCDSCDGYDRECKNYLTEPIRRVIRDRSKLQTQRDNYSLSKIWSMNDNGVYHE